MACGATGSFRMRWVELSSSGPALCYHIACVINDVLYVHGGINKKASTAPLNGLHKFDLKNRTWQEVTTSGSPFLSHHSCVVVNDRYIVCIGGWDGKVRSSDVHTYDSEEDLWLHPATSGFPVGGGLSSHSSTLMKNGDIFIIGREGSLRMQRRSGNAFQLKGDFSKQMTYSDHPIGVASRSGHTVCYTGHKLLVLGGRNDKLIEQHSGFHPVVNNNNLLSKLSGFTKDLKPLSKPPWGRKHHVAVGGHGIVLVHGGETFDGRSRDPVNDMFLLVCQSTCAWYRLDCQDNIGRQGHICVATGDEIIIHGGQTAAGVVVSDVVKLQL